MKTIAPFAASAQLRQALSACGQPQVTEPGTVLFQQGEAVRGIYVVNSGKIRLSLTDPDGLSAPERIAQEGSVLGLPATMGGSPYTLTACVQERAQVVFVDRERALALLRQNPMLCFEVVEILAHEVSHMRLDTVVVFSGSSNPSNN
jgi:CRP-like cAMP-binding protein